MSEKEKVSIEKMASQIEAMPEELQRRCADVINGAAMALRPWQARRRRSEGPLSHASVTAPLKRRAKGRRHPPIYGGAGAGGEWQGPAAGSSPAAATTGGCGIPPGLPEKYKPQPVKAAPQDQAAPVQFRLGRAKEQAGGASPSPTG